jgi:hypothetical protein
MSVFRTWEGKIMFSKTRFAVVVVFLAFVGLGVSAVQAAEQKQTLDQKQTTDQKQGQNQDQWRYTFHNGEWWYWLPEGRWVYWRNSQWNAYDPKNYASPNSSRIIVTGRNGSSYGNQAANDADIRPFYGHSESNLDRRSQKDTSEIGPFYGHALPSDVFSGWRARRASRPFYGHAVAGD